MIDLNQFDGLKPCPCCGGEMKIIKGRKNDDDWGRFWENYHRPICSKCGLRYPDFSKHKEAAEAVNTRSGPDLLAECKRLQSELDDMTRQRDAWHDKYLEQE